MTVIGAEPAPVVRAAALRGSRLERTLLHRPGSADDTTTRVVWLQADALYCDVRLPAGLTTVTAPCLSALTLDDLLALATQDAFAGRLVDHGDHVEWTRTVELHAPGPHADAGTLTRHGERKLVEHGHFEDYLEEWSVTDSGLTTEEFALVDTDTGAPGVLVRAGDHFGFARGRTAPVAGDLADAIRGAATLTAAQSALDCEVSLGRIHDDRWLVTTSTLPYRVGADLNPIHTGDDAVSTADVHPLGHAVRRRWHRTQS